MYISVEDGSEIVAVCNNKWQQHKNWKNGHGWDIMQELFAENKSRILNPF